MIMYSPYLVPPWLRVYLEHSLGALSLCALSALEMYLGNRDVALMSAVLVIPIAAPNRWDRFSAWVEGFVPYGNSAARSRARSRRLQRVQWFREGDERAWRVFSRSWSERSRGMIAHPRRPACPIRPRRGVRATHRSRQSRQAGQSGTRSSGQESDGGEGGPDGPADVTATVADDHVQRKDPGILSSSMTGCPGLLFGEDS